MSKARSKGTRFETAVRGFLSDVWHRVERTAFDHSTAWGSADLKNTGRFSVECKNWKEHLKAIGTGWPQAVRNAAYAGKIPILVVSWPRRNIGDSVVVMRLEDWKELTKHAVPGPERERGQ